MTARPPERIDEVDPTSHETTSCLEQYFTELQDRFEEGFDVAKSVTSDPQDFARPRGAFLVIFDADRPIGCGGVTLTSPTVGYIKRMWVERSCRGRGLGRRLLAALEATARDLGCDTVQLETHRALEGAIQMYRRSGYREVQPFNDEYYADHWFEKELR